jgi:hypothetical protein
VDNFSRALVYGRARSHFGQEPNSMSNTMSDDYFSFMSAKGRKKEENQGYASAGTSMVIDPADTIDFVGEEEPTIEVTESFVSDTTIQRIFKQFRPENLEAAAAAAAAAQAAATEQE